MQEDFPRTSREQLRDKVNNLDFIPIGGILRNDHQQGREFMKYVEISRKELTFLDLTSLTVEEFNQIVPAFEEAFQGRMEEAFQGRMME